MNVTVFEAINITKKYRNTLALNQVSMSVMQGDIYGFIGENGAGKSTLMKCLFGIYKMDEGEVYIDGVKTEIANPDDALHLSLIHI